MSKRSIAAVVLGLFFVVGAGVIVYRGRPVMQINDTDDDITSVTPTPSSPTPTTPTPTTPTPTTPAPTSPTPTSNGRSYTFADVAAHGTQQSCWSAVNGSVYDLTTWISRHPGGAQRIIGMCGQDASAGFNRQHGNSRAAQAALILLKIGSIK